MDTPIDMCCVDQNITPVGFTGDECTVSPYNDEYEPIENVNIWLDVTAVNNIDTGQTNIYYVNQSLYFVDSIANSLLNPN